MFAPCVFSIIDNNYMYITNAECTFLT